MKLRLVFKTLVEMVKRAVPPLLLLAFCVGLPFTIAYGLGLDTPYAVLVSFPGAIFVLLLIIWFIQVYTEIESDELLKEDKDV